MRGGEDNAGRIAAKEPFLRLSPGRNNRRDMERVMGIEPTFEAWEAPVLPLNYTRRINDENRFYWQKSTDASNFISDCLYWAWRALRHKAL